MKKVKIFLVALITVLLASGAVLAANWPNMSTGPSGSSGGTGGGGSDYRVSCQGSRTRYVLYDQNNTVIKNYVDTSGLIGNTHEWFSYKKKNGKITNVTGVSEPKVKVGDELFEALLDKAGKKPSDVITTGKNTFKITAEILVNYAPYKNGKTGSRVYLSYKEAKNKGWIDGSYSKLLWNIACDELGNGNAMDTSQGTYYLPVILHKDLDTQQVLAKTDFNDYSAEPEFTLTPTTGEIASDYEKIINDGYGYVGVSKGSNENEKTSPDVTAMTITTDENNLYVTFWYSKGTNVKETWVTTNGETIAGPKSYLFEEGEESHTFSRQDEKIDENIYTYIKTTVDGEKKPDEPVIISNDKKPHEIIYVYERKSTITVYHKIEGTNQIIDSMGPTVVTRGDTVGPYNPKTPAQLTSLGYEDAEYTGVEELKDDKVTKTKSKRTNVTVEIKDEGKYEVIFWYKPSDEEKLYIKIDYVCKRENDFIAPSEETSVKIKGNYKVPVTIKKIDDKHEYKDYKFKISDNPITYPFSGGTSGTGTPNVNVDYTAGGRKYVEIVLYYECPEKVDEELGKIHHIYIDPISGSETVMASKEVNKAKTAWYRNYYMYNREERRGTYLGDDRQGEGSGAYNFDYPKYPDDYPTNPSGEVIGYVYSSTVYHDYDHLTFWSDTTLGGGHILAGRTAYLMYDKYDDGTSDLVTKSTPFSRTYCYSPTRSSNTVDFIERTGSYKGYIYYTDQVVNYRHVLVGTSLNNEIKELSSGKEIVKVNGGHYVDRYANNDYLLIGISLNGSLVKGGSQILSDAGYQVNLKEGQAAQNIVFYYKKAPIDDPSEGGSKGLPVVCDASTNKNTVKLDESFTVTIPNEGRHELALSLGYTTPVNGELFDPVQEWNSYFAAGKYIQFDGGLDVEYNGSIYTSGTPIKLAGRSSNTPNYEALNSTFNFTVPVWVEDNKTYTAKVWVTPAGNHNSSYDNPAWNKLDDSASGWATAEISIKVIGKIYDFTVTNIQGDDVWKNMLQLPSINDVKGEYKSPSIATNNKNLPIVQESQRSNTKYNYALRKGTKLFFSVNTKGIKNESIKILPKFYYVSKDGNTREEVDVFSKNTSGKYTKLSSLPNTRISNTNNSNKLTKEFLQDRQKAISIYTAVKFNINADIGSYVNILLNNSFKFPYYNYLINEEGAKWKAHKDEITILKSASQWYGDYLIPSDAKFAKLGTTSPTDADFNKYTEGYVILLFKIESQTGSSTYLPYDTVWGEEGMTSSYLNAIQLPKIAPTVTPPVIGSTLNTLLTSGYAPVAIYQANISTSQNYDTTGSH